MGEGRTLEKHGWREEEERSWREGEKVRGWKKEEGPRRSIDEKWRLRKIETRISGKRTFEGNWGLKVEKARLRRWKAKVTMGLGIKEKGGRGVKEGSWIRTETNQRATGGSREITPETIITIIRKSSYCCWEQNHSSFDLIIIIGRSTQEEEGRRGRWSPNGGSCDSRINPGRRDNWL